MNLKHPGVKSKLTCGLVTYLLDQMSQMSSDTNVGSDMQIELQVNHYQQLAKQVQDRGRAEAI